MPPNRSNNMVLDQFLKRPYLSILLAAVAAVTAGVAWRASAVDFLQKTSAIPVYSGSASTTRNLPNGSTLTVVPPSTSGTPGKMGFSLSDTNYRMQIQDGADSDALGLARSSQVLEAGDAGLPTFESAKLEVIDKNTGNTVATYDLEGFGEVQEAARDGEHATAPPSGSSGGSSGGATQPDAPGSADDSKSPSDRESSGSSGGTGGSSDNLVPCDGTDCTIDQLKKLGINIFNFLMGIAGIAAVGAIVSAGFAYVYAHGDSGLIGDAKKRLGLAIIGLAIVLTSVVIVNTILSKLEFKGVGDSGKTLESIK